MIGRVIRKCDFERMLAMPPCSRSAHFALHYLQGRPSAPVKQSAKVRIDLLSTGDSPNLSDSVDNTPSGHWLGNVMPKRHAPRSVTRNMLRRQVRAAMLRHEAGLRLVRLRQPFPATTYLSADSSALRAVVASELDRLLARVGA
jgi:ribonuclease P protein component